MTIVPNKLTPEQLAKIAEPLPPEAIAAHPRMAGLSTIKGIFVTERLNQVFGVGAWVVKTDLSSPITTVHTTTNAGRERIEYTAVAKTIFTVPEYAIYYECIASSTNSDPGDAAKGATTDAITKIASWIGIGIDVYKGKHGAAPKPANANLLDLNDKLGLVPSYNANLLDLNDRIGPVSSYDELTTATLKADFLALLDKLPKEQAAKFMKDIDHMTPARFEKGIQFIQNQLAKL
jgi:hypothetical protein